MMYSASLSELGRTGIFSDPRFRRGASLPEIPIF